jgi:outer membrane protein assembly factor BamD
LSTAVAARGRWQHVYAVAVLGLVLACAGGMPKVPASPAAILERADDYFRRGKEREAIALYTQFIERFPGHERADYAQFRLAESEFKSRDYELASVEYQILITNYGYSEYVDDAVFQMGVCSWNQAPKFPRDQQKAVDALSRFNQFLLTYPDNLRASEARSYVRQINTRLAEKAYSSAKWYYRQREPKAALVYCEKIIRDYPDNEYWADALLLKGQILVDRGDNEGAVEQYTQIIAYPGDLPQKQEAERRIKEARK